MNKNHSFKNSLYYLKYIGKFDGIRIPGVLITALLNAFDAWFLKVAVIKAVVDALLDSQDFRRILLVVAVAVGFKSLKLLCDSCWSYYIKRSDQRITAGFQHIVFSKAADVDLQCYDNSDFYNDYVYSVQDSSTRPVSFVNSVEQLLQTVFTVSFSGLYIIFSDPFLLIFAVIPILGDSFIRTRMNKAKAERVSLIIPEKRKIDYVKRTSYLKENAIDIRTTKIPLVLGELFQNGVDNIIGIYRKYSKKFIGMYFISDALTHLNNTFVILYLVYKIVVLRTLTAGDFIAIKEAISLVSSNLGKIMERVQVFQEHGIFIGKFRTFCEYENKVVFGTSGLPDPESSVFELKVNHASFAYNPEKEVLHQIDIAAERGKLIAIVGSNAAGKSTLVKLLLHMYDVTGGSVEFRDKNVKEFSKRDYLSEFGTVFQEHNSYAFSFTDNIAFSPDLSEGERNRMKEVFHSLDFDEFLPFINREITLTKEFSGDGLVLSGGQTQKMAVARALYRNNSILILDEPTSALDAVAEHKLSEGLKRAAKDRTVVLISHRLSSVRDADCIYFMEDGRIIEQGTHDELMEQQGRYCEMFLVQAKAYRN